MARSKKAKGVSTASLASVPAPTASPPLVLLDSEPLRPSGGSSASTNSGMEAAVQCLASCAPFAAIFREDSVRRFVADSPRHRATRPVCGLSAAFCKLVDQMPVTAGGAAGTVGSGAAGQGGGVPDGYVGALLGGVSRVFPALNSPDVGEGIGALVGILHEELRHM